MAASATGRAVGAATRRLAHALTEAVGADAGPPPPAAAAAATWVCTPVYRNRTTEFCVYRNAAQRAQAHAESYVCAQPAAPAQPTAAAAAAGATQGGWLAWLTGAGTAAPETALAAACPACGRAFGPTEPRRTCGTCGRTLCAHCAQTAVLGRGAVWCCCRACRARVPPRVRAALFAQSVADAAHTPLARLTDGLRAAHAAAAAEVAKLEYLADSLAAGTAGALQADAVQLARRAAALATAGTATVPQSQQGQQQRPRDRRNDTGTTYEAAVLQQQTATDALARFNALLGQLRGATAGAGAGLTRSERAVAGLVVHRMAGAAAAWCATLRACTERLSTLELATATLVDVALYRCCLEAQDNPRFAALFARPLADCERVVGAEMRAAAEACSAVRWDAHRARAKDAVFKWDAVCPSLISDEPSSLLPEAQRSSAVSAPTLLHTHTGTRVHPPTEQRRVGGPHDAPHHRRAQQVSRLCREARRIRLLFFPLFPPSLTRLSAHMEFGGGGGGVRMQGRLPKTKDALAALIDTVQRHFVI